MANTARILVRFGIESFRELRTTRGDQRAHLIADAKKSNGFKSLKLVRELFSLFPPIKRGWNIASLEYTEAHLPKRLQNCTADLSTLAGSLRPTQEMVNLISEDTARGESNPHPFPPLLRRITTFAPGVPVLTLAPMR